MRLTLLPLGVMQPGDVPVAAYLIQTGDGGDTGKNVLVDSGWPRSYVDDPLGPPGLSIEMQPHETVAARLASVGLQPSDIVVCSHLDDDHTGNHDLFTNAEFVVQKSHYEEAKSGHPRYAGNRSIWDHPSLRYRTVEGDTTLVPGVELLETTGHVTGHQSVLVRLPETGPVLLAIDAVMHSSMAEAATREIYMTDGGDEADIRASTQKIADIAKREDAAMVIYGHDAGQWSTLRVAPASYR